MELFDQLHAWHWFVLAVVLFALELMAATGFLIGIGLAALVLAVVVLVLPDVSWDWQLLGFGLLSVALTVGYKVFFRQVNDATDNPLLNDRAAQLIGRTFVLDADLDATGAEMIGDTRWSLRCAGRINRGTRVRIVNTEGMVLVVEADS
ncbi:MAG: NfeD family protein [Halioglobus sp.]